MKKYFYLITIALLSASCSEKAEKQEAQIDSTKLVQKPMVVNEVYGIAIIEPAKRITNLSVESGGIIRSIKVDIGQSIVAGQTILIMDNALESAQLNQANSKIETQRDVITASKENINNLRVQLKKAQEDYARDKELFEGKALTKKELDDRQYAIDNISQQIKSQETGIRQQETKIKELNADIAYFQTIQGKKVLKAAQNGTLLSLDAKVGQYLGVNSSIGDFAPAGPTIALTEIDELFAAKIKIGQKAFIKLQGSDEVITTGTVILASPYLRKKSLFADNSNNLEDRRVREVRVQLDDATKVLLGARVECVIKLQ
jgi:HlyD family secretion protein